MKNQKGSKRTHSREKSYERDNSMKKQWMKENAFHTLTGSNVMGSQSKKVKHKKITKGYHNHGMLSNSNTYGFKGM